MGNQAVEATFWHVPACCVKTQTSFRNHSNFFYSLLLYFWGRLFCHLLLQHHWKRSFILSSWLVWWRFRQLLVASYLAAGPHLWSTRAILLLRSILFVIIVIIIIISPFYGLQDEGLSHCFPTAPILRCSYPFFITKFPYLIPTLSYCSSASSSPIFQYAIYYPGGSPVVSSLHYIFFCYCAWCNLGI